MPGINGAIPDDATPGAGEDRRSAEHPLAHKAPCSIATTQAGSLDEVCERAVLGALLVDDAAPLDCVEAGDFAMLRHRLIFAAIGDARDLAGTGAPLQTSNALERAGRLPDAGGWNYVQSLADETTHSGCLAADAVELREHARRRKLGQLGKQIAWTACEGGDVVVLLAEAQRLADGAESRTSRKPTTPALVLERWESAGPLVHLPCGLAAIDERTGGGFTPGTRSTLMGGPDAGKTAMLMQIADGYLARGLAVGILAVDEEADDVLQRLLQRRGFSRRTCEQRNPADLVRMQDAIGDSLLQLYGPEWSIEAAADDLAALAKERGVHAMFGIDSLQTVRCRAEDGGTSRYDAMNARVAAIRAVTTAHRFVTVSTSEMARGAYRTQKPGERTDDMAAAKESGAIEYSARVLMSLRNVSDESDLVEMRFPKNKLGPATRLGEDGAFLRLDRVTQTFTTDDAYKPASGKAERGASRMVQDAAAVACAAVKRPGMLSKDLNAAAAVLSDGMGHGRYENAKAKLGDALVTVAGKGTRKEMFIDGSKLPEDVANTIPLPERLGVLASRPPASPSLPRASPGSLAHHPSTYPPPSPL